MFPAADKFLLWNRMRFKAFDDDAEQAGSTELTQEGNIIGMASIAAPGPQACGDRDRLVSAMESASAHYSQLVNDLTSNMGRLLKADYELLRSRVEPPGLKPNTPESFC